MSVRLVSTPVHLRRVVAWLVPCLLAAGCTSGEVSSDAEARQAYLALDPAIAQALDLGFQGFAAAKSANIDAQTTAGAKGGSLTVAGKVDQGSSDNKNMDLTLHLLAWTSDASITFDTAADVAQQPKLALSLKKLPDADLTGTLVGDFAMTGALKKTVALHLTLTGKTMADATGKVVRKPGTIHVIGTASAGGETFAVDVTH
jgi:hypothetical protein